MVSDKIGDALHATMSGTLKEGLIEDFEEAIGAWQELGGPEIESYFVPELSGGPLRLTARTDYGYDFVLKNDDVWVGITTRRGVLPWDVLPYEVLIIYCLDEALHRCDLDDLEDAANAIAGHFFKDVLVLEHAREYAQQWFGLSGGLKGPFEET